MHALNKVESQENQVNEGNTGQNDMRICDIISKILFVLLFIPWFISIIHFSIFDTKCIVFEQASVVNCSQDIFLEHPTHWVFAWLLMSSIASSLVVIIVYLNRKELNYQGKKLRKIHHKGSFNSLMFLLAISEIYYIWRAIDRSDATSLGISILIILWPLFTATVVCCLNYLPHVYWTKVNKELYCYTLVWLKDCFIKNCNFAIYRLTLVVYFVEVLCKLTSIMLDVAQNVAPLIQTTFPDEAKEYWSLMALIIGFRMAFHARLLTFFWLKFFHGDKDLFSEPSDKLVDEQLGEPGGISLQQIVCMQPAE